MASRERRLRILDALGRLLDPVVLLLLKSGITFREFSDLARMRFVQVATRQFGIRGRPTNASRVAILTGLDRRDVRKLRLVEGLGAGAEPGFMSKPTQVLDGWFHDPSFRSASGGPRDLHISEGDPSFAHLLRRYAPGIPPVAMIKELRAVGAIEELPDGRLRALKRNYIPRELTENQIRLWGSVLQDVGTTLEHNLMRKDSEQPRFERRALRLSIDPRVRRQFEEFLALEGQAFLERVDDWLAGHQIESTDSAPQQGIRLGVGVYEILDEQPKLSKARPAEQSTPRKA
jgi:hypothetical protein